MARVLKVFELSTADPFKAINISYYQSLFDRSWSEALQTIENEFWDVVSNLFHYSGDGLKSLEEFNAELPLTSKKAGEGQSEIGSILCNIEDIWFDSKQAERTKRRLLSLVQNALSSAWFDTTRGQIGEAGEQTSVWIKVEIVRNQVVFGPSHSSQAINILQHIHDAAAPEFHQNHTFSFQNIQQSRLHNSTFMP